MLIELTGQTNLPVFVDSRDISAMEQKKVYTYIYVSNTNVKLIVKESAAEVYKEIENKEFEEMIEGAGL